MEGAPVTGEPSQPEEISLTKVFQDLCPVYMIMGMSYDEFWNRNTAVHKAYRKAYEMRRRNEEWARWRQAAYIYDVLLRVSPILRAFSKGKAEPEQFMNEPWPLTQKEAREREEREARERYFNMRNKLMAEAKKNRERRAEEAAKEARENAGD